MVCGITSLGYDHTDVLGPTLSDIAWHKGGISKVRVCAVSLWLVYAMNNGFMAY